MQHVYYALFDCYVMQKNQLQTLTMYLPLYSSRNASNLPSAHLRIGSASSGAYMLHLSLQHLISPGHSSCALQETIQIKLCHVRRI